MAEDSVEVPVEDSEEAPQETQGESGAPQDDMATIWSPEPTGADEVLSTSIEEWIADVEFESTADVPIPERLVDQVIGQEAIPRFGLRQNPNEAFGHAARHAKALPVHEAQGAQGRHPERDRCSSDQGAYSLRISVHISTRLAATAL